MVGCFYLSDVLRDPVESEAGLVGDNVQVLTDSLSASEIENSNSQLLEYNTNAN